MKNSLFKRAVATAVAVPLALTQCLTASFAVGSDFDLLTNNANAASSDSTITLDSLCYIDPAETVSTWNLVLGQKLASIAAAKEGTIDLTPYIEKAANNAGRFSSVLESVLTRINEDGVTYEINADADIVITAKTDRATEGLYYATENSLKELAAGLAETYGKPELANIDFLGVSSEGTITVTIKTSELNKNGGTTVPVEFNFNDGTKDYNLEETIAFVKAKIEEFRQVAYAEIDKIPAGTIDADGAKKKVDDNLSNYVDALTRGTNALNKLTNYEGEKVASGTFADVIAAVNRMIAKKGFSKQIPATATAALTKDAVATTYASALDQFENMTGVAVDIEAAELGAFLDGLTDVSATVSGEESTFTGYFEDAEIDAVKAYYATQNLEVVSSVKKITVTADYADLKLGAASVDLQIERIVETKPIETTSTTTSVTTTTDETTTTTTTAAEEESSTSTTTTTTTASTSTETQPVVTTAVAEVFVELDSTYGFYLDIDEEFNKGQVSDATLNVVYVKGYTDSEGRLNVAETYTDQTDIVADLSFGDATPANTYTEDNTTFKYNVALSYAGANVLDQEGNVVLASGAKLTLQSGAPATITAYIGVKGDASLNNMADPEDASLILVYNAAVVQNGSSDGIQLSNSPLVTGPTSVYDSFAAFLGDVTHNAPIIDDWNVMKADRLIDSTDASAILVYNANVVQGDPLGAATWLKCVTTIH